MELEQFLALVQKVQAGQATAEEKFQVLQELNLAAGEYENFLKAKIDELQAEK